MTAPLREPLQSAVVDDRCRRRVPPAETVDQIARSALMKRYLANDEQVAPILFLASDEASYITGKILPVAGGDLG